MAKEEKQVAQLEATRHLYTVRQFIDLQKGKWPSEGAIRSLILDAAWEKNDFQKAFKRVNRRVLVDSVEFWAAVDRMQEGKR